MAKMLLHFHYKILCFLGACILSTSTMASGDGGTFPIGARAAALSNAAVTLSDSWAFFNNIAGIATLNQTLVGFGYHNAFGVSGWATGYAHVVVPIKEGVTGIGVERFGNDALNITRLSLGYALKVRYVSLGLQATYQQVQVTELGTQGSILFNFGGQAEIIPELVFGAHITNMNQAKMAEFKDERVPTILKAGMSYRPNKRLMINAETAKDVDLPASFRFGVEYALMEEVWFARIGTLTFPASTSYGVGFVHKAWMIDYALQFQNRLGFSHHLNVAYKLVKNNP